MKRLSVWIVASGLFLMAASCGSEKEKADSPKGTVRQLDAPSVDTTTPPWLEPSRSWPSTVEWTLDAQGNYNADGLEFRIRLETQKMFTGGTAADVHPLWARSEIRLKPVPSYPLVQTLKMDSIVFFDPVRNKKLPALSMLSGRRTFADGVLRTQFASNAAARENLDLDEDQPLQPKVYFTWNGRTIICHTPEVHVRFVTEHEGIEKREILDWGSGN